MRFFDVFDAQGRKLGSFRISPVAPGAGGLGYVLTALLLLLFFGGGVLVWRVFFQDGFYLTYTPHVVITMILVALASAVFAMTCKTTLLAIVLSILTGALVFAVAAAAGSESPLAGLILGIWLAMFPSVGLVFLFRVVFHFIYLVRQQKKS